DTLEAKYMAEDTSGKKFLVSNFTNYKMTDSRPVLEQYNELLGILEDFKHTLKYLKEELTLVELGSHLRIEESLRAYNDNRGKRKHHDTKADPNKKPKVLRVQWMVLPTHCKDDDVAWWVDSGATVHVCKDRCWFKTYESLNNGSILHMRNESTALVHGRGCVNLRLNIVSDNIGSAFMLTSKLNDSILWRARLGHVHFKRMQDMSKDGLIPAFDMDTEKFYVIEPNESVSINSIIESRDAIFDENRFSSVPRPSLRIPNGTEDIGGSVVLEEVTEEDDLKTFDEAMKSQDVAFWKEAINDEMDSIMGNNTWVLADLPPGCKPLGCKWIFKRKLKVDGTIEKFKARLVIQGFKQKSGIDYFDTYTPVACISTIRLLIAMASIHNLIIHQMDVNTVFLNGDLDEEVYMNQLLEAIIMPWSKKTRQILMNLVKIHHLANVMTSDLCTDQVQVDLTKKFLSSKFSIKDMGETDVILGIRIKHESNEIAISQSHYIKKVLKKFNYFDCTLVGSLIDTSKNLMPNNGQAVSQLEYSRVIGCLMYVMTCTRPDIAFVVGKLSRYTSNPGTQHWQAIQRASKKQTCITGSTMESEFVALAAAGKEAECAATLAKAYSQMYNEKSRHLGVRHIMIHELITNG
ncbi:zinc finger, CCHC-type containing protein, partial [Tanacetum coccineum]